MEAIGGRTEIQEDNLQTSDIHLEVENIKSDEVLSTENVQVEQNLNDDFLPHQKSATKDEENLNKEADAVQVSFEENHANHDKMFTHDDNTNCNEIVNEESPIKSEKVSNLEDSSSVPTTPMTEKKGKTKEEDLCANDCNTSEENKSISSDVIKEYLPWCSIALVGFILLLVSVILIMNGSISKPKLDLARVNIPSYQGLMKIKSLYGNNLLYNSSLKYVGSIEARKLRNRLEPKLRHIYKSASLDVESVLVIAFKFSGGGGINANVTANLSVGQFVASGLSENSIVVQHWIFLKKNTTLKLIDLTLRVKRAAANEPDIVVIIDSISLKDLTNMTSVQTIIVLSQNDFFTKGIRNLDMSILTKLGVIVGPVDFGIQNEGNGGLCPSLRAYDHLFIYPPTCLQSYNTFFGLVCSSYCAKGYYLSGSPYRICLSSGHWSGSTATCKKKCPPLHLSSPGKVLPFSCSSSNSTFGQTCFFHCPATHRFYSSIELPDGSINDFRECLEQGKWSGNVGFCKARCAPLDFPLHVNATSASCKNYEEGDICSVKCMFGYILQGGEIVQQLKCNSNGQWNKLLSPCKKLCSSLLEIPNQMVAPTACRTYPHGGIICNFDCAVGYKLIGNKHSLCNAAGAWSNDQPSCVRTCGRINNIAHGIIHSEKGDCEEDVSQVNSSCTLLCDAGFTPSTEITKCDYRTGNWTESNLTCLKTCPKLNLPVHGQWIPSSCSLFGHHSASNFCSLQCDSLYQPHGSTNLICDMQSGTWDNSPGECIMQCNEPMSPVNGYIQGIFGSRCNGVLLTGTTCHVSCDSGYILYGEHSIACQNNGLWSSSNFTCVEVQQFVILQHLLQFVLCLAVNERGVLVKDYNCSRSIDKNIWSLEGSNNLRNTFSGQCLAMKSFTSYELRMDDCKVTNSLQHFKSHEQYKIITKNGKFVSSAYRTSNNFTLLDVVETFNSKADWKFENVETQLLYSLVGARNRGSCLPLQEYPNVVVSPRTCGTEMQVEGALCNISCNKGFKLYEAHYFFTKCKMGAWNISFPVICIASISPSTTGCAVYPTNLLHGVQIVPSTCFSERVAVNTKCSFSCINDTQYLSGPQYAVCNEDTSWSLLRVTACKRYCPSLSLHLYTKFLTTNRNACISGKARSGDVCTFACDEGFTLIGPSLVTCFDSGKWDNVVPTCEKLCPSPILDGLIKIKRCSDLQKYNGFLPGTTCSLYCPFGYDFADSTYRYIICDDIGYWNTSGLLKCEKTCPSITLSVNETIVPLACADSPSTIGSTCIVTCKSGYYLLEGVLTPSIQRTCSSDHMWHGAFAKCISACSPLMNELPEDSNLYLEPFSCSTNKQVAGTVCKIKCQGSYVVHGGDDTLVCSNNGSWVSSMEYSTLGSCVATCQPLFVPKYAEILPALCTEEKVKPGIECFIQCPSHMERIGPGKKKCLGKVDWNTGSVWSAIDETRCVAKCVPLIVPHYAYVFPKNCEFGYKQQGDSCMFECERGLKLMGATSLYCNENGVWIGEQPLCYHTCVGLQILHGNLQCNFINTVGYDYMPGTSCTYTCDKGYAASSHNKITCLEEGIWTPDPFCERITPLFRIFQKVAAETKCLLTTENTGSNWMLSLGNTVDACLQAGNNAKWHWIGKYNIKHAETGLCLKAEWNQRESLVGLEACDYKDDLQHWNCDVLHPFRLVLKETDLGIDSTYVSIGPVLERWTHAQSYWITFNEELETTASLCSYKPSGTCPGIKIGSLVVYPAVCSSDEVSMWQKCDLQCEEQSYLADLKTASTVCLPTGRWKDIELVRCVKRCPPFQHTERMVVEPNSCTVNDVDDLGSCSITCEEGYEMSNGEIGINVVCENGSWNRKNLRCLRYCPIKPIPPINGETTCHAGYCTFSCNPGYKINSSGTVLVECFGNGTFSAIPEVTCQSGKQFIIQSLSASFGSQIACLTLDTFSNETIKVPCNNNDVKQYWKWEDDKIHHVATGICLAAISSDNITKIIGSKCNTSMSQKFFCLDSLHPYHIFSALYNTRFIDLGEASYGLSVALQSGHPLSTAEWLAFHPNEELAGSVCSFKASGICPTILLGPASTVYPRNCAVESIINSSCTVICDSGFLTERGMSSYNITCLRTGMWDSFIYPCISQNSTIVCPSLILGGGMIVKPETCANSNAVSFGSGCFFMCQSGYYLNGSKIIYCQKNRSWSVSAPVCTAFCPGFQSSANVNLFPQMCLSIEVPVGMSCTQTCADGYVATLKKSVRKCEHDGTWSGDEINCQKSCPSLSLLPYLATHNSSLVSNHRKKVVTSFSCAFSSQISGSLCSFHCPTHQVLVDGPSYVVCLSNNTWSSSIPRCILQFRCPKASSIGVRSIVYEPLKDGVAVISGTGVFIDCMPGFKPIGDKERLCLPNGEWDGKGLSTPACAKLCSLLPFRFLGTISPSSCHTQYSGEGQTCMLECFGNAWLSNGYKNFSLTCNNGVWSDDLPSCLLSNISSVDGMHYDAFMMISRTDNVGCFIADENDLVVWKNVERCDVKAKNHIWKWTNDGTIINLNQSKCLQPVVSGNITVLGVASCDEKSARYSFICGNPRSFNDKFLLYYYPNETWEMTPANEFQSSPIITMSRVPVHPQGLSKNAFLNIAVHANSGVKYPLSSDRSVCAYACGGIITRKSRGRYLLSPGYLQNQFYPPHSQCEWTLTGYKITIRLLEIDLEGEANSSDPCKADCIQVYNGASNNILYAEHLKTFTGNNILAYNIDQGGTVVISVAGSMFVHFTSNGVGQNKGFAISYEFNDLSHPTSCGLTSVQSLYEFKQDYCLGIKVAIAKWPWVASLRELTSEKKALHRCSGVLVDESIVVTSAQCSTFAVNALKLNSSVVLGVGYSSQASMDHDMSQNKANFLDRVFIHPDYDFKSRRNDIALWKLKQDISFTYKITPVCMPMDGYNVHNILSDCFAAGWNELHNGAVVNQLKEYKMEIISKSWCEELLGVPVHSDLICTKHVLLANPSATQTLHSEPLICRYDDLWYLVGISSYTRASSKGSVRLYVSINAHQKWMRQTIFRTSVVSYRSRNIGNLRHTNEHDIIYDPTTWFSLH